METEKPIPREEIIRVVREYIQRMMKLSETHSGCSTDELIDCPGCGHRRSIQHGKCLYRDCFFSFPAELRPPTREELADHFHKEELKKRIEMFLSEKSDLKQKMVR